MINFCKNCIMPDTRPRIVFDSNGVCNACNNSLEKKNIDWSKRKKEFEDIIEDIKKTSLSNKSNYDCIVPWSGGKDSTSIAIKLKLEYGLNPLLVTFSPLIPTAFGEYNKKEIIKFGFDNIQINPNQRVSRYLAKRFFIERGNPKVGWDAGVNAGPIQIAINFNIPYVFYAEHGESEYGGLVLSEESKKKRDTREVIEHQIGDYPENWVNKEITLKDLSPYIYPDLNQLEKSNVKAFYFSYFFKWSMYENFIYTKEKIPNFKLDPNGRTEGTFTNFDSLDDKIDPLYYYMQYIKFGFGRATRDSCRMLQNNHTTRSEAIINAKKYDGEYPERNIKDILKYLSLTTDELDSIINKHRNPEIWKSSIDNKWNLINTVY